MSFSGSSEAHCLPPILPCQPYLLSGLYVPFQAQALQSQEALVLSAHPVWSCWCQLASPGCFLSKHVHKASWMLLAGKACQRAESSCLGAMIHPLAQTSSHLFCLKDEQGGPRQCTGPTSGMSKQILGEFAWSTVLRARSLHRD